MTALLSKYWCFTWNNYPDDADDVIKDFYDRGIPSYVVYQREVGETTGTPHLQGFVNLKARKRLTGMKKVLSPEVAWYPAAAKNVQEKVDYCKKESTRVPDTLPIELGELVIPSQGVRTDLNAFMEDVKAGMPYHHLIDKHPGVFRTGLSFAREFFTIHSPDPEWNRITEFEERPWHSIVNDFISKPDDRKILFIVDPEGGLGKTTLAKKLVNEREDAQFFKPAKEADLALSLDNRKSVFILDCPRCRHDIPLPYMILESIKDGMVFSGKYQSCMKRVTLPNVVIVFTNDVPDPTKLSLDRFVVKVWRGNNLVDIYPDMATEKWHEKLYGQFNYDVALTNPESVKRISERNKRLKYTTDE